MRYVPFSGNDRISLEFHCWMWTSFLFIWNNEARQMPSVFLGNLTNYDFFKNCISKSIRHISHCMTDMFTIVQSVLTIISKKVQMSPKVCAEWIIACVYSKPSILFLWLIEVNSLYVVVRNWNSVRFCKCHTIDWLTRSH